MAARPNIDIEERIRNEEFENFTLLYVDLKVIHDRLCTVLAILGVIGGIVGLGTMISNRYMKLTSFLYHKILVGANLIYCLNSLVLEVVDNKLNVENRERRQFIFYSKPAAYYSGTVHVCEIQAKSVFHK